MRPNNVTNPVNREKLKQVLKKYNMSFDAYLEEKMKKVSLFSRKRDEGYKRFMQRQTTRSFTDSMSSYVHILEQLTDVSGDGRS